MSNLGSFAIAFVFLLAAQAVGAPSRRPMPEHLPNSNDEVELLRDHQDPDRYFAIPRRFRILVNKLVPFGAEEEGCNSVVHYDQAVRTLVEAKQEHALTSLNRFKQINKMLEELAKQQEAYTDVTLKKAKLELELVEKDGVAPAEEVARIKKGLEAVDRILALMDQRVAAIDQLRKAAEQEQTQGLEQVTKLEKSLGDFEGKVIRPAGRIQIRAALAAQAATESQLRQSLKLREKERISFPSLVGLELFPTEATELGFRERLLREETIGVFRPEWNVKALPPAADAFEHENIPSAIRTTEVPTEIQFEQIVSLYSYCALKRVPEADASPLLIPLRVGLTVAGWDSPSLDAGGAEIGMFRRVLSPEVWAVAATLPTVETLRAGSGDPGHPQLYLERGVYKPLHFSVEFVSSASSGRNE